MMEISRTASVPPNNDRPSFLTLPAEIRNMIYGLLFERDGPVMIHNVRGYYAQKPVEPKGGSQSNINFDSDDDGEDEHGGPSEYEQYQVSLQAWLGMLEAEEEELRIFDHGLSSAFGLLKSCRQIYHESAGVLYGHNTFTLSRVSTRHDLSDFYGSEDHEESYHQLRYAPKWLRSLGSQYNC